MNKKNINSEISKGKSDVKKKENENSNFKIINYYSKNKLSNARDIENKLFHIFKKYEV